MALLPSFSIAGPALVRWARLGEQVMAATRPAIAKAVNAFGEGLLDRTVEALADQTGLPPEEVRNAIVVRRATANSLRWEMDARAITPVESGPFLGRPWPEPERGDEFDSEKLLNIIGHEDCCEVCEKAIEENPHTQEQINNLAAVWANFEPKTPVKGERTNLLHPNCRCATQPWKGYRRVPVTSGRGKSARTTMMTAGQLGEHIGKAFQGELRAAIRATLRER